MGTLEQSERMVGTLLVGGTLYFLGGIVMALMGAEMPHVEYGDVEVNKFFMVGGITTAVTGILSAVYGTWHFQAVTKKKPV